MIREHVDLVSAWRTRIEASLHEAVVLPACHPKLQESVKYAVLPAGKLLRPLLVLGICQDANPSLEVPAWLFPVAAAVELLHAASLVHDDLPALDNDALRRGRPSCHVAFGESTAILTGDAIISIAFGALLKHVPDPALAVTMGRSLTATWTEICDGQVRDLNRDPDVASAEVMTQKKTGALFAVSAEFGALASGSLDPVAARAFGLHLGVAFQAWDDILDDVQIVNRDEALRSFQDTSAMQEAAHRLALLGLAGTVTKTLFGSAFSSKVN